jgi:tRNA threonylcarbamoyl adenosine modification protein (Sua5/YciO/YrdC/YwlC family)
VRRINITPDDLDSPLIKEIADTLLKGGIVALPTETVWGLAVLPTNKSAVERLYAIKKRDHQKPFTYHIENVEAGLSFFSILPPYGYRLVKKFWPGPLTIVSYSKEEKKVGVRVPSHRILAQVLKELNQPIYLPSANISGEKEVTSADEVEAKFDDQIDLIVDGEGPTYFIPSTVVDLTYHPFKILREGAVSVKEIVDTFIKKRLLFVCTGNTCRSVFAEYLLKKYLPQYDPFLLERYEVISRGISPQEGMDVAPLVRDILKEKEGIQVRDHRAKRLDRYTILSADLIFTMDKAQEEYILKIEPTAKSRIFPLKKFLPPELEKDIPDPITCPVSVYQEVYELIKKAILEMREWL